MDKRGELTSQQIAILVLGIAGFVLVFLFLFAIFDNQSLTERELCKLSILERATLPDISQKVPLQCTTEKVCITLDMGLFGKESDCKQFAGEENVRVVEVKLSNDVGQQSEAIRTIERETANAIFDCWAMTGQGKLDVFRGEGETTELITSDILKLLGTDLGEVIKTIQPKCIVCSRVALSEELVKEDSKFNILRKVNSNEYMARELVPGSTLTYLQTMTDESVRSYVGIDKEDKSEDGNEFAEKSTGGAQIAVIFMQIKTLGNPDEIAEQAAIMAGTAIGSGGLLTGVGRKAITKFPIISTVVALAGTGGAYLAAKDIAEDNQAISFAACGGVEKISKESAKLGCSLVKPVVWDVQTVNDMCFGGIEGNL